MIELIKGNILEAEAEALVNTVNTQGVMGKGIALQFKKAFPEIFAPYKKACDLGEIRIGKVQVYERSTMTDPKYIINFPTKDDWRKPSRLEYIEQGLQSLIEAIEKYNINSIAVPPLGCGHGGLNWADVYPLIQAAAVQLPTVKLLVYLPAGAPEPSNMINKTTRPSMTASRAIVLQLLEQYCVLGYELTLLEIHKLLYFLQEAGEPLKLRFKKHIYGPYADNLRQVLSLFEGHFTSGFGDGSNKPGTPIRLLPGSLDEAKAYLKNYTEAADFQKRLNKVKKLILGFESPHGMELLATIHWLIKHESVSTNNIEELIEKVQAWNQRKKNVMKPEHIQVALQRLQKEQWV